MIIIAQYRQQLLDELDNRASNQPYHSNKYDYNLFIIHINSLVKYGYK